MDTMYVQTLANVPTHIYQFRVAIVVSDVGMGIRYFVYLFVSLFV